MALNNQTNKPHLIMLIQPQSRIRFRYKSEGSSHGGLRGKEKVKGKKSFPTVKLEGYEGNRPVFIRVTLYTEDNKKHVLEFMGPEESVSFIDEHLLEDNTAVFENLKILCKKKEDICELLLDRKMEELGIVQECVRKKFEKQYIKEFKDTARNIMNSVRLCFEAFETKNSGKLVRICEPLFSDIIRNQKAAAKSELRIHRMSRISGTWKGGDEIILLCDKVQKENIEIIFYESGVEPDSIEWESKGIFTPVDVHYQVAITFKTPQYKMNAEKTVCICLSRNGELGEPLQFTFIPDVEENPSKKRKIYASQEPVSPMDNSSNSSCNGSESSSTLDDSQDTKDDLNGNISAMEELGVFDVPEDLDAFWETNKGFLFPDILSLVENDQMVLDPDLTLPEDIFDHQPVINQSLKFPEYVTTAQIDGVLGEMASLTISESFGSFSNQKTLNRTKSQKLPCINVIKRLLGKRDKFGNTVLHVASDKNKNIMPIVNLSKFAKIDIVNVKNSNQETALHLATKKNNKEAVKILLSCDGNPNLKNVDGNNCYHLASEKNHFDVMRYLLTLVKPEYSLDLNGFNYAGLTPLHISVKNNSEKCYHLLKSHSDLNATDQKCGQSLLHYAVKFQPTFVKILLNEEKIDINSQDFEGNTPLHLACSDENTEVIKQLMKAGADPALKNFKKNHNTLEENSEDCVSGQMAQDLTSNSKILEVLKQECCKMPGKHKIMERLYTVLDKDMKWKDIAIYVMDEEYMSSLECSPSPGKALIQYIQKRERGRFVECLKPVLEITGPSEALDIISDF